MMVGVKVMLERMNQINELYDIYQPLLTAKQQEYIKMYYHENLSLAEIADEVGVSRNAVYDNIKRTYKSLTTYEAKLGICANKNKRTQLYQQIKTCTNDLAILEIVRQLSLLDE